MRGLDRSGSRRCLPTRKGQNKRSQPSSAVTRGVIPISAQNAWITSTRYARPNSTIRLDRFAKLPPPLGELNDLGGENALRFAAEADSDRLQAALVRRNGTTTRHPGAASRLTAAGVGTPLRPLCDSANGRRCQFCLSMP